MASQDFNEDPELDVWPDLLFWYPGLTQNDLLHMPRVLLKKYIEALPRLLAERTSRDIQATAFPHMDKQPQKRLLASLDKAQTRAEVKRASSEDEQRDLLSSAGIGFTVIEPDEGENGS